MKRIAVFFDALGFESYPFDKEEYRTAYHELAAMIAERGGQFCVVRGQDSFQGNGTFSGGWVFESGKFREEASPIHAHTIYNKGYFRSDATSRVLNDPAFDHLCTDKWETYRLFPSLSPLTRLVKDEAALKEAASAFGDKRIVAKPLDGEEGKGVMAGIASELMAKIVSFPYLLQEFIDTSGGVPGIVEGIHDLRIIGVRGEPMLSYVRTPPPGKLLANVALGGREIPVPLENVPADAMDLYASVDRELAQYPQRVYSVDMGRDRNGTWKIIELNSKPGLSPVRMGPQYERFLGKLADTLLLG
jgi:hypothetical protein